MAAVKVYMPLRDQRLRATYSSIFAGLGMETTSLIAEAEVVFPLSDSSALLCAGHPRFMPQASLDSLLNKDQLGATGIPILPTVVIQAAADAPAGMLVKPRNSVSGGLVYQPHLGFPLEDLDISFTVNMQGEIMLFATLRLTHYGLKDPGEARMALPAEVAAVLPLIQRACSTLAIKGGAHNLQFVFYEGQWCILDWNPRPYLALSLGLAAMHPLLTRPLAFMIGAPLPDAIDAVFQYKSYRSAPIPHSKYSEILKLGLLPRVSNNVITRVSGVSYSAEMLDQKFAQLAVITTPPAA